MPPDHPRPEPTVLVMAPPGDPAAAALASALRAAGITAEHASQAVQGLTLLCHPRPHAAPPRLIIVLSDPPGMAAPTFVRAVRSLPGAAGIPFILVGAAPTGLRHCTLVPAPPDIGLLCRLAAHEHALHPHAGKSAPHDCQAAQEIRRTEAGTGRHLPIIAATADSSPEAHARCLHAGMDEALPVHLDEDPLRVAMHRLLPGAGPAPLLPLGASAASCVLDPGPLQRMAGRAPAMAEKLLRVVHDDLLLARQELPALLAASDLHELARVAHKLAGGAGIIGAAELSQACLDLEKSARDGAGARCRTAIASVLPAISRLDQRLDAVAAALPREVIHEHPHR